MNQSTSSSMDFSSRLPRLRSIFNARLKFALLTVMAISYSQTAATTLVATRVPLSPSLPFKDTLLPHKNEFRDKRVLLQMSKKF